MPRTGINPDALCSCTTFFHSQRSAILIRPRPVWNVSFCLNWWQERDSARPLGVLGHSRVTWFPRKPESGRGTSYIRSVIVLEALIFGNNNTLKSRNVTASRHVLLSERSAVEFKLFLIARTLCAWSYDSVLKIVYALTLVIKYIIWLFEK